MRRYVPALWLAMAAHAAVIRGVVVENQSGKVLARTAMTLEPVEGTPGTLRHARTNLNGAFEFDTLPPGTYVLRAARLGFMPMEYGQKRWNSAGTPVKLEDGASLFLNIRMLRYSAIRGTVADENDVGLPEHEVVAYRNTSPPQLVAQAQSDERGVYRLHGLEPGTYLVRTAGKRYEDAAYLPTFSTETERVDQARMVDLVVEQEAESADVRPLPGNHFFTLTVEAGVPILGADVVLTVASELGRKTVRGTFARFDNLPAGDYEIYAEARLGEGPGAPAQAGYQRISLGRDTAVSVILQPPPPPPVVRDAEIALVGGPGEDYGKLWVRRKDLAGVGTPYQARIVRGRATLQVGRWEVLLEPPHGYYVRGFSGPGVAEAVGGRRDGWNEVLCRGYTMLQFTMASGPGGIRGTVKQSGEGVGGVPVYLEGYDADSRTRVTDLRTTRTDARGQYYFADLAPGKYRVLGTFEYTAPGVAEMDLAGATMVTVTAHAELPLDLDLYVIQ